MGENESGLGTRETEAAVVRSTDCAVLYMVQCAEQALLHAVMVMRIQWGSTRDSMYGDDAFPPPLSLTPLSLALAVLSIVRLWNESAERHHNYCTEDVRRLYPLRLASTSR